MKTTNPTLSSFLEQARHLAEGPSSQPVGLPIGTVYSHTYPCDDGGGAMSGDWLVLVRLTGGPMVMGSIAAPPGQRLQIGTSVRMILEGVHQDEQPASHRHRFEAVMITSTHSGGHGEGASA
ncbi:MAG: hypothetical protein KGS60_02270 [Verrucomicrobia bacterium]|nr:hypothetical protein [Verrucomicrobiota bacterium]